MTLAYAGTVNRMKGNHMNLKSIRQAAELSQATLAERMGMSSNGQRTVSQIEAREDWLLSSVASYIRAAGGTAELTVTVNGDELRFKIA